MQRIVRRVINYKYRDISPQSIKIGSAVPFDIFIKRYEDYVIIIDAGTHIDEELHQKLMRHEHLYVLLHDHQKFKDYLSNDEENVPMEQDEYQKLLQQIKEFPNTLYGIPEPKGSLEYIYSIVSKLMENIFEMSNEKIPLKAIEQCASIIADWVKKTPNAMLLLLQVISGVYATNRHSTNVAFFSAVLANALHLNEDELFEVTNAALVHDIGKIRIDQMILLKPERLEEDEFDMVRKHSEFGHEILEKNGIHNKRILEGVLYHHEKLDGSGYPKGLKGKLVPRYAKIIGVCDVFDALTTDRTYRTHYTTFEALLLMKKEMSIHFEEMYIDTFIRLLKHR